MHGSGTGRLRALAESCAESAVVCCLLEARVQFAELEYSAASLLRQLDFSSASRFDRSWARAISVISRLG